MRERQRATSMPAALPMSERSSTIASTRSHRSGTSSRQATGRDLDDVDVVESPQVAGDDAALAGIRSIVRPHERWLTASHARVLILAEVARFSARVSPYDADDSRHAVLVDRTEQIVEDESLAWVGVRLQARADTTRS